MLDSGNCSLEFSLRSSARDQVLWSAVSVQSINGFRFRSAALCVRVDGQSRICVDYVSQMLMVTKKTSHCYRPSNFSVDRWTQVSLNFPSGIADGIDNARLFVDGVLIEVETRAELSGSDVSLRDDHVPNMNQSGKVVFGADEAFKTARASALQGEISEIRIWGGGRSGWILEPAFTLNLGVPVEKAHPRLKAYWPFWDTLSAPLKDEAAGHSLVLGQDVTVVRGLPRLYDDLTDIIANTPRAEFPSFATAEMAAAFADLMRQAGLQMTPASLRQAYQRSDNDFQVWLTLVSNARFDAAAKGFSQGEFELVRSSLCEELIGVSQLWKYYSTASQSFYLIAAQFQSAASHVMTVAGQATAFRDFSQNQASAQIDPGTIIEALSAVASVAGTAGKATGYALKGLWTLVNLSRPPRSGITLSSTIMLNARASEIVSQATALSTAIDARLRETILIVARDAGLLRIVATEAARGQPPRPPLADLNAAKLRDFYNMAVLYLTKVLIQSCFKFWIMRKIVMLPGPFGQQAKADPPKVRVPVVQSELFGVIFGARENPLDDGAFSGPFNMGGAAILGYFKERGHNGYPTYYALESSFAALLNDAAKELGLGSMQRAEVFTWLPAERLDYS